jgi:hypothetical protein
MIRTLIISGCAALLPIGFALGAASAGGVMLPMSPVGAPELTAPSFNAYSNSFDLTKGKGIGDDGMFRYTSSSPEIVSILSSRFSPSDMKDYANPTIGGAITTGSNSYNGAVSITEAPEVSTWAMTLLGFAGLGFMGSLVRKRRGADPIAF